MVKKSFAVKNTLGLHARPSASFAKEAGRFQSQIMVECDGTEVNGKSILGLMMLGAGKGRVLEITATGKDEDKAIESLGELIEAGFNEP